MDHRRVGVEGLPDVQQRRLLGDVELDGVDRFQGGLLVLRRDECDRLPLVAKVVLREQRLVGRDPERGQVPVLEQWDVLPRDHRMDALHRLGRAGVEPGDVRAMDRRAERLDPERPRDADVVDEGRASGDVLDAVVARKACADRFHFTPPMLVMPGLAAVVARSNESPRATAATASMIFT